MKKLILHIGHSKCASSTLQAYLCDYLSIPVKNVHGDVIRYAAALEGKKPLLGKRLKEASSKKATQYISSTLNISSEKSILDSLALLSSQCGQQDTVILSNEGWAGPGLITDETIKAFEAFAVPVEIFMLTRPPVDWFNASWWQWGVWTGQDVQHWYNTYGNINYLRSINRWNDISTVVDIKVADISQGPIESLLHLLEIHTLPITQREDVNKATHFELLKHLIKNREKYGRTTHNPTIEFQFNNQLQLSKSPPPPVTSADLAKKIIAKNANDYKILLSRTQWCKNTISDEVTKKYIDENCYDNINEINFESELASGYTDEFVGQLINNIPLKGDKAQGALPRLYSGDAEYLSDLANKIEKGIMPGEEDVDVLKMLALRAHSTH